MYIEPTFNFEKKKKKQFNHPLGVCNCFNRLNLHQEIKNHPLGSHSKRSSLVIVLCNLRQQQHTRMLEGTRILLLKKG